MSAPAVGSGVFAYVPIPGPRAHFSAAVPALILSVISSDNSGAGGTPAYLCTAIAFPGSQGGQSGYSGGVAIFCDVKVYENNLVSQVTGDPSVYPAWPAP